MMRKTARLAIILSVVADVAKAGPQVPNGKWNETRSIDGLPFLRAHLKGLL